ncbi:LytTR family DNA-binding domain-containing protein [Pedobacter gandavensis]|uniref:LytR/AlgR family response regulator transcription factor n=1 Tax=Pedobacter TaxID=84567 RepID=UPI0016570567|nr:MULTISPECIES: LytTR family DNA-binding domain-containing protein [Pedobacter]MBC8987990.1 response regulator transcription factor [Pedobacter sp. N36a]WGQ10819.1 LytTR family DNA-binding domain-containing protein [Pedobacter gandavensis]
MKLKCIAIDDEPLALEMVCNFIKQTPFLILDAHFDNAIDALRYLDDHTVALVFLDIQMPDLSGLELAKILSSRQNQTQHRLIFTTAYSEFALDGYKVDAIDYLLKPFVFEEFFNAASKARKYIEHYQQNGIEAHENAAYIFVKVDATMDKINLHEIVYVEGFKDYIKIHLQDRAQPILSLMSLKKMERLLPQSNFLRIHRSYIVSLLQLTNLTKKSVKVGNKFLSVGENYKEQYNEFYQKWAD